MFCIEDVATLFNKTAGCSRPFLAEGKREEPIPAP
jgi:hypothetical protein